MLVFFKYFIYFFLCAVENLEKCDKIRVKFVFILFPFEASVKLASLCKRILIEFSKI